MQHILFIIGWKLYECLDSRHDFTFTIFAFFCFPKIKSYTFIWKELRILEYNDICGIAKTWALALGLSPTFYQQYVRGEEIMGESRN